MNKHRNIPYKYEEWTSQDGTKCSTELEQDMIAQIDEYINNREVYEIKRKLSNRAAADFYKTLNYKGD